MPLVLRLYREMDERLRAEGLGIRMVCARGPMTVASWLVGVTPLLIGLASDLDTVSRVLDTVTTTIRYHPTSHHSDGPASHMEPHGTAAARSAAPWIPPSTAAHPAAGNPASQGDMRPTNSATSPQPIATATKGAIRGLSTSAIGLNT